MTAVDPDTDARRITTGARPEIAGTQVREDDIDEAKGLHWVAILFRIMSGLLAVLMLIQVVFGLTSTVPISFGILFADAVKLTIFAGLLWAAGDLADLYVKSHHDVRATRILVARLNHAVREMWAQQGPPPSR